MTSKEVVSLALFLCHQPKAEDDDPEPTQKSERIKHTMDYESFKEKFVEDLKDRLDEQGADVKVSVNTVNKLNEKLRGCNGHAGGQQHRSEHRDRQVLRCDGKRQILR